MLKSINPAMGNLLGYVIAGHHTGLLNGGGWGAVSEDRSLQGRLKKEVPDFSAYRNEVTSDLYPPLTSVARQLADTKPLDERDQGCCFSFLVRMIFSCLVDADFLDTEEFMNGFKITRGRRDFAELEDKVIQHANNFDTVPDINKSAERFLNNVSEKLKNLRCL